VEQLGTGKWKGEDAELCEQNAPISVSHRYSCTVAWCRPDQCTVCAHWTAHEATLAMFWSVLCVNLTCAAHMTRFAGLSVSSPEMNRRFMFSPDHSLLTQIPFGSVNYKMYCLLCNGHSCGRDGCS